MKLAPRLVLLPALLLLLAAACAMATRRERDQDGGGEAEVEPNGDLGPVGYETCELEDTEAIGPDEYVIQIHNRECSTRVCVHYQAMTFCTHLCETSDDCADVGHGACALGLYVGEPEFLGRYCVPSGE